MDAECDRAGSTITDSSAQEIFRDGAVFVWMAGGGVWIRRCSGAPSRVLYWLPWPAKRPVEHLTGWRLTSSRRRFYERVFI